VITTYEYETIWHHKTELKSHCHRNLKSKIYTIFTAHDILHFFHIPFLIWLWYNVLHFEAKHTIDSFIVVHWSESARQLSRTSITDTTFTHNILCASVKCTASSKWVTRLHSFRARTRAAGYVHSYARISIIAFNTSAWQNPTPWLELKHKINIAYSFHDFNNSHKINACIFLLTMDRAFQNGYQFQITFSYLSTSHILTRVTGYLLYFIK
jgi:hypothetical protein